MRAGFVAVEGWTGRALTADQEFEAGLTCSGVAATPTTPTGTPYTGGNGVTYYVCPATQLTSKIVKPPAPNTKNDDHNPQRIQPRHLFDLSIGHDNLFNGDRYKWSVRFTAINITNKVAAYNFFSTFSGTHYVTPRSLTAEVGFHF